MKRWVALTLILGTFYSTCSYGGGDDLQTNIQTFVACYRTLPEDGQLRHLRPLSQETKDIVLSPLKNKLLEINPQEHIQPELFHLLNTIKTSETDPTTSALDVFKHHLDFSASLGPWTTGDQELSLLFRAVKEMKKLSFDSQLSPQVSTSRTLNLMLPGRNKNDKSSIAINQAGAMFYPVVGKTLFNPALLTECFIQNIFLVALSTQKENVIHGLPTSSLGHMLHDIAHGMLVINTKREKFEEDFDAVCQGLPFKGMTFGECETFKGQTLHFLLSKNEAYEAALLQAFNYLKDQKKKPSMAGIFFAIHEAGIAAWPHPLRICTDFAHVTKNFLQGAVQAFQGYYEDPWGTSPKDGKPHGLETIPSSVPGLIIPEGAATKITSHGIVLEAQWAKDSLQRSHFFRTQKWTFQESEDAQKTLKWGLGREEHEFHLPLPDASKPDEDFRTYNKRTLEGIEYVLKEAQTKIAFFLVTPEGQKIQEQFSQTVMKAEQEFLEKTQKEFSEKSYWDLLQTKVGGML